MPLTKITKSSIKNSEKNATSQQVNTLPLWLSLIIAWLAGASFSWSLAPHGVWVLAIISPAILYALLKAPMSNKRAFAIGEAYGMGYWCVGAFWLYNSIHTYGSVPAVLALAAIAVMGLGMGVLHGLLAVVFNRYVGKQPLSFASLWVLQEWLKTWVLTGFPWLFVGYAFTGQAWLASIAPVFGVFALSFVAVFVAAALVELFSKRVNYAIAGAVMVATSVALWVINPQWTTEKNSPNLSVSLIQGNIPQDKKWLTEYQNKTLEIYATLTRDEWGSDVVIWPEASIPMFQTQAWDFITGIAKIASDTNTTWVTGVPFMEAPSAENVFDPVTGQYPPFYNAVMSVDTHSNPSNNQVALYKKQRLVPFGEYIPMSGVLDLFPNLGGGNRILNYSKGEREQAPLPVKGQKMGSAVCYEVAYPDTTRRNAVDTDFMLTISNDAWFGTTAGPWQHLQMVQMRAIETGRWFLRATNTGVTVIIDEQGQIVKQAPQFERTVLRGQVQAREGKTPYVHFGNLPVLSFVLLALLAGIWHKRR